MNSRLPSNHLGPFLLTGLLLDRMDADGRIVNVASQAHYRGIMDLEHIDDRASALRCPGGLCALEARQRDAHLRAGAPPGGKRYHRELPASGHRRHEFAAALAARRAASDPPPNPRFSSRRAQHAVPGAFEPRRQASTALFDEHQRIRNQPRRRRTIPACRSCYGRRADAGL